MALHVSYSFLLGRIAEKLNLDVMPNFSLHKTPSFGVSIRKIGQSVYCTHSKESE